MSQTTSDRPPTSKSLFPDPAIGEQVLHDYLRRADRMGWSPYDLVDDHNIQSVVKLDRLNETQVSAIKTVLYVEDHLPGYLASYLQTLTDPDLPDDQCIMNRQVLRFTFRWAGEEDRHSHVLEMYLKRTGLVPQATLEAEMLRERKTAYDFPYKERMIDGVCYLALQEKATQLYYRALAKDLEEPLMKSILTRMAADEASHATYFYDLLIKCHQGDLDSLAKRVSVVSNDFKMPVQSNLTNYRRQLLSLMRSAPSYKHGDVFANMMKAIDQAADRYSRDSLELITPIAETAAEEE